ncbi:MAG: outer membrane beta-barrel domain-containing protein [Deltaproteobacteria bacterium]|nr:outer membrane beta-barrel domain-containing protein [Deltaproteobacteria bacterium]
MALVCTSIVVATARAENPMLADQPPVRKVRPLLDGRHTLAPQFGMTLADPYQQNLLAGLYYRYHVASWLGFGVDLWAGGGVDTSLTDDIDKELSRPGRPFELSTSSLQLLGNLAVELVPFSGKAMLFSDALLRVDLHLTFGVGVALVAGSDDRIEDSTSIAPTFGVGLRIFPSSWLSIGLELRDYLVNRALASRRDGSVPGATFDHNWLFGLSVGFSFPTTPEVQE